MAKVLVLEGDSFARSLYTEWLGAEGFEVAAEPDLSLLLAALEKRAGDVLVAEVGPSEPGAGALLSAVRRRAPGIELLALVERGAEDTAARALRQGAHSYLLKPVTRAALALAVRRCLELARLVAERPALSRELALYRRCQALLHAGGPDLLPGRVAEALAAHAGAGAAVVLAPGSDPEELEPLARLGLDRERATRIAKSFGEMRRGAPQRQLLRELGEPVVVDVPGRFQVALFGVKARPQTLDEDLAVLGRVARQAAELSARYGEAADAHEAIDPLSGIYDERYLRQVLEHETARQAGGGPPVSLLAIDLDGFRHVNDRYGHLVGSRALVEAARILERSVRGVDVVARTGGDEYAIALVHTSLESARKVAERLRRLFESHLFLVREGLEAKLTISIGVAGCPTHGGSAEALLGAAEQAVDEVKSAGGNKVGTAPDPGPTSAKTDG